MKLTFSKECTHKHRPHQNRIFQRAFEVLCRELGITDANATVEITFKRGEDIPIKVPRGQVDGAILPVDPLKKPIPMLLALAPMSRLLHTLAHEMVHVHQCVRGDLRICPWEDTILWKGKLQSQELLQYARRNPDVLPQEREAYAKMDDLFLKVLASLDPADASEIARSGYVAKVMKYKES